MTEINQDRRNLFIGSSNLRTSRMLTKAHSRLVSEHCHTVTLFPPLRLLQQKIDKLITDWLVLASLTGTGPVLSRTTDNTPPSTLLLELW